MNHEPSKPALIPLPDVDLVIFDCDGVIADSEIISADVLVAALARHALEITPDYVFRHFVGKSFPGVAAMLRSEFQLDLPMDFEANYRADLLQAFEHRLQETPGLSHLLPRMSTAICVATSSSPPRVARTLQLLGHSACFGPHVFTASQVARGKPAPDLFLFAAAQMGASPDRCLVIEDSTAGVTAGLAAGMRVWRYVGGAHFDKRRDLRSETPAETPIFDNWDQFPVLAANL